MSRVMILITLVLVGVMLSGCIFSPFAGVRSLPTIGPVRNPENGGSEFEIAASTDCAEVGEVVTISVWIRNPEAYPQRMGGSPPFEVIIEPGLWPQSEPRPQVRFSESNQYPQDINPILAPGEERNYVWYWRAEEIHVQHPETMLGVALYATLVNPTGGEIGGRGKTQVGIGVGRKVIPGNSYIPCAELRQP